MLLEKIKQNRIEAMKSGDKAKRATLQLLLAKIEKEQIANKSTLTNEQVESVISKSIKELDKEIESYVAVGRSVESQNAEKELLFSYLPKQLTLEEASEIVKQVVDSIIASNGKIGDAIKELSSKLKGKTDMKVVSKMASDLYKSKQ